MTTRGVLEQARASFAERLWGDARAKFETADATESLDLDDLEKLALASYLTGHDAESTRAWTRAHHEAIRRGDPRRAARNAFLVGSGLIFRGETAPAMGWFARGGRLLEGCGECAEHVWLHTWNARCGAETRRVQRPRGRWGFDRARGGGTPARRIGQDHSSDRDRAQPLREDSCPPRPQLPHQARSAVSCGGHRLRV